MSVAEAMLPRLTDAAHEDWCCTKGCTCGDCRDQGGREADCSCLVRIIERHARQVDTTARGDERRRVEAALRSTDLWWHSGGAPCLPLRSVLAALAQPDTKAGDR